MFEFVFTDEFARQLLIWQGIRSCGQKIEVFVINKTKASKIYKQKCLKNCVFSFIIAHNGPIKLWLYLTSCHYSGEFLQWYRGNGVDFTKNDINFPNFPQLLPIEKFWSTVKHKLKKSGEVVRDATEMTINIVEENDH